MCKAQAQVTASADPGDLGETNGIQGRVHPSPLSVLHRRGLLAKGQILVDPSQAAKVLTNLHDLDQISHQLQHGFQTNPC